jgi:putative transposase
VTPHTCFLRDGREDELTAIRKHLQQERALESKRFQAMAERTLGRPVSVRRPGRPRRDQDEPKGI